MGSHHVGRLTIFDRPIMHRRNLEIPLRIGRICRGRWGAFADGVIADSVDGAISACRVGPAGWRGRWCWSTQPGGNEVSLLARLRIWMVTGFDIGVMGFLASREPGHADPRAFTYGTYTLLFRELATRAGIVVVVIIKAMLPASSKAASGLGIQHFVSIKDLATEDAVLAIVAFEGLDALDPFPDNDTCRDGADPTDVIAPGGQARLGDIEDEKDDGDEDRQDGEKGHEGDVDHFGMVKGKVALGDGIVDDPCTIQETESQLKEVGQGGDGVDKVARADAAFVDKVVEDIKEDVEGDEGKGGPLDDDFFALSGKQADERLGLGKPDEEARDDADDLELDGALDLVLDLLGVIVAILVLLFGDAKGVGRGNGQRHGHGQGGQLLQPGTTANADARGAIGEAAATEEDGVVDEKTSRGDHQHEEQGIGQTGRRGQRIDLRDNGGIKGISIIGIG